MKTTRFGLFLGWFTRTRNRLFSRFRKYHSADSFPAEVIPALERILNLQISNPDLFFCALTHRSITSQTPDRPQASSNERLEFLGDAVLNLATASFLYERFPDASEGELTRTRSRIVSRKNLGLIARELRLHELLQMSQSTRQSLRLGHDTILGNSLEALIGAVYLDSGMTQVERFLNRTAFQSIDDSFMSRDDGNYKSILLEYAQAHQYSLPIYKVIKEEGPDHARMFTIEANISGLPVGIGTGKTKKEAEQRAAANTLSLINQSRPTFTETEFGDDEEDV